MKVSAFVMPLAIVSLLWIVLIFTCNFSLFVKVYFLLNFLFLSKFLGITCHIDLESKENLVLTGYMNISTEIFSNGAIKYFSDPQNLENNFVSTKLSNISYIGRSTNGSCNKLLPGFCALKSKKHKKNGFMIFKGV